ncbi:hypothetical protein [Curtobacterium poinsettiae]|uniref:hypothetical protein n=1 Tax=Curtobacterium poinsettiae TaxID=159612 RepID=UPI0021CA1CA0|nr:hypothetical protein [Curtobacterium flaccumfaciens]MCU0116177.1 hypothetical protein [Curtobacterium flaccumfaciens]
MKKISVWILLGLVSSALVAVSGVLVVSAFVDGRSAASAGVTGLVGALLGAGGAIGAQIVAGHLQAKRDALAARRTTEEAARNAVLDDNRVLLNELLEIHRELQRASPRMNEILNPDEWRPRWKEIWTEDRSLRIDAGVRLVSDSSARERLSRLIGLMDESYDFTDPARPGRRFTYIRQIGLSLTAYAIAAVSEYLRRDPIAATDEELLAKFEDEVSLHAHWWEQEVTRAEELSAEAEAEAIAATGDGTADRSGA